MVTARSIEFRAAVIPAYGRCEPPPAAAAAAAASAAASAAAARGGGGRRSVNAHVVP